MCFAPMVTLGMAFTPLRNSQTVGAEVAWYKKATHLINIIAGIIMVNAENIN